MTGPVLPGRVTFRPPPTPRIVMGPPQTATVHVVPVSGPPGDPGIQGPPGTPGAGGEVVQLTRIAFDDLGGHRIVTLAGGDVLIYASNDDIQFLGGPLWMTTGAIMAGESGTVLAFGPITEPTWNWDVGPVYLGTNGLMTQDPPTIPALFSVQIGFALSPISMFFNPQSYLALDQE